MNKLDKRISGLLIVMRKFKLFDSVEKVVHAHCMVFNYWEQRR